MDSTQGECLGSNCPDGEAFDEDGDAGAIDAGETATGEGEAPSQEDGMVVEEPGAVDASGDPGDDAGAGDGGDDGGLGDTDILDKCNFHFRKRITINPAQVSGDLSSFPVLVSWQIDADLAAQARSDGHDILFRMEPGGSELGIRLSHDLELFDNSTGELVAWVMVPSLSPDSDVTFYIYYGNPEAAASTEDTDGVWDSNFVGVWHLNETPTGASQEIEDSSRFHNHGQGGEGDPLFFSHPVRGPIGYGQDFNNSDGKYDLIDCGNDPSIDMSGNQITIEAWIKHHITPAWGSWYGIVNHKGFDQGYRLLVPENQLKLWFQLPGSTHSLGSTTDLTPDVWHHLAATYDGQKMRLYIDGQKEINELDKTDNLLSPGAQIEFWIGHGDQPKDVAWSYEWKGQIDEVRLSNIARSSAWIQTEFCNQASPSAFFQVGPAEPVSSYCP